MTTKRKPTVSEENLDGYVDANEFLEELLGPLTHLRCREGTEGREPGARCYLGEDSWVQLNPIRPSRASGPARQGWGEDECAGGGDLTVYGRGVS